MLFLKVMIFLTRNKVIHYLRAVAPVPYANYFSFYEKIYEFAKNEGFKIDEYTVLVNGNQLFKPYRMRLYEGASEKPKQYDEIYDVKFEKFWQVMVLLLHGCGMGLRSMKNIFQ